MKIDFIFNSISNNFCGQTILAIEFPYFIIFSWQYLLACFIDDAPFCIFFGMFHAILGLFFFNDFSIRNFIPIIVKYGCNIFCIASESMSANTRKSMIKPFNPFIFPKWYNKSRIAFYTESTFC